MGRDIIVVAMRRVEPGYVISQRSHYPWCQEECGHHRRDCHESEHAIYQGHSGVQRSDGGDDDTGYVEYIIQALPFGTYQEAEAFGAIVGVCEYGAGTEENHTDNE